MKTEEIDRISRERALKLFASETLASFEVGTTNGLKQIHDYLFNNLYDFAGEIREKNISKDDFRFANCLFLPKILEEIDKMPEQTYEQII